MDFYYRNIGGVVVRFELNSEQYEVHPGQSILIPEKYDYAIELMKVKFLEKDYEESISHDQLMNPHLWDENSPPSVGPIYKHTEPEPIAPPKKERRKKQK